MEQAQARGESSESSSHKDRIKLKAARALQSLKQRPSARSVIKLAVILTAFALVLFPLPSAFVERFYSNGLYPKIQSLLTPVTNSIPFAIVDLLAAGATLGLPAWWIARIVKAGRGRRLKATARLLFNTLTIAAIAFLGFELLWGFNYSRLPLPAKLDYDEERLSPEATKQLKRETVEQLNTISQEAHNTPWPDEAEWRARLHESLDDTVVLLGNVRGIAEAIPKRSLLNFYLAAAGIDGFVNPFGQEVILDSEILPFEKPFLLAHQLIGRFGGLPLAAAFP